MKYDLALFDLPSSTTNHVEDFSVYNGEGTLKRKIQQRSLEMMIELDRICRKHSIQYWLIGGSLIGAVRHKGFIPWDDDIDVAIRYQDIKRLRKALIAELPKQYVYQDWTTDKKYYLSSVVKIRDTKSYFPISWYCGFKEQGLLVDIIPWEKVASMKAKQFILKVNKYPYLRKKELSMCDHSDHDFLGILLAPVASLAKFIAHFIAKHSKRKNWGFSYTYVTHPYTFMSFNDNFLFPLKEAEFEGHYFLVPNDSVAILKQYFGDDVLDIPGEDKRSSHTSDVVFYE